MRILATAIEQPYTKRARYKQLVYTCFVKISIAFLVQPSVCAQQSHTEFCICAQPKSNDVIQQWY